MLTVVFSVIAALLNSENPHGALKKFGESALFLGGATLALLATPVGWAATTARCFAGMFHPGAVFTNYEEVQTNA